MHQIKIKMLLLVVASLISGSVFSNQPETVGELKSQLADITRQNCQVSMFVQSISKTKEQCLATVKSRDSHCQKQALAGRKNTDAIGTRKAFTKLVTSYQFCIFEL